MPIAPNGTIASADDAVGQCRPTATAIGHVSRPTVRRSPRGSPATTVLLALRTQAHWTSMAGQVTRPGRGIGSVGHGGHRRDRVGLCRFTDALRWAGMAYDVARVRGLHPSLGDGWVHFDAQNGMLLPDSVATTVSTAFRGSDADTRGSAPVGAAQRRGARRRPPGGGRSGQRRPARRGAGRRPRDLADVAGRRVGLAGRAGLRGRGHPARRRGEHRAVAARSKPLRRQGEVGRGRHRDRRTADVAVGEPDHHSRPGWSRSPRRRRRWAPSPTCGR